MYKPYFRCLAWMLLWLLPALWARVYAQPGGWSVKSSNFQFSMSVLAQIETGGQINAALNNHLAAFSGGQIRGYAKSVQAGSKVCYFLNVYANNYQHDKIYFMAFVGGENRVYECTDTVSFLHQKNVGTLAQPYLLHFTLSPRPLIYSLANIDYVESGCAQGPLLNIEASDDLDAEGNGLTYSVDGGADAARFTLNTATGVLNWNNFTPDFEQPADAGQNNTYEISVKVTDTNGNFFVQQIVVRVVDDYPPTAVCPGAKTGKTSDDGTGDCSSTVTGDLSVKLPPGCGTYPVSYLLEGATTGQGMGQLPAVQVFSVGKTTVRYTVTDDSGSKQSSCSFTVTITDDEPLSIQCPAPKTAGTQPGVCYGTVTGLAATVNDNCAAPPFGYTLSGVTSGSGNGQLNDNQQFNLGITTVVYTVRDNTSQQVLASCSFKVTIADGEPPSLSCPADISTALTSGCSTLLTGTGATVTDNCAGMTLSYSLSGASTGTGTDQVPGGQRFNAGVTTVQYTAADGAGQSSCSFKITIVEKTKPDIHCPGNQAVMLGSSCTAVLPDYSASATVSDNCTPTADIAVTQTPAAGATLSVIGTQSVQLTATDGSGNTHFCTFAVSVQDNPDFTITCPPAQQVCSGSIGDYRSLAGLTGICGMTVPPIVQNPASGTAFPANTTQMTVTFSATDGQRSTQCAITVTLGDTQAPTARCKAAVAVMQAGGQASIAVADVNDGSTDNCGIQNISLSKTTFTCSDRPLATVVLTVTDLQGASSNCSASVTFSDPNAYCCSAPDAICRSNPAVTLGANNQVTIATSDINNNSLYTCGLQSMTVSPNTANCSNVGFPLTVTLTVTDLNGASDQCTANVTVRDLTPPGITCPADQTVAADANCRAMVGDRIGLASGLSDNCSPSGSIAVGQSPPASTVITGHNQFSTVYLTATDLSGNNNSCSFKVIVKDVSPPTGVCKPASVQLNSAGTGSLAASAVFQSGTDNCGTVSPLSVSPNAFTCSQLGANTVVLTVQDGNGNSATCNAVVTVVDNIPPTITCPPPPVLTANPATCTALATGVTATVQDNCGAQLTYVLSGATAGSGTGQISNVAFNSGQTTVTFTATDAGGQSTQCSFVVTVSPCFKGRIIWKQDQTTGVKDVTVGVTGDQSATAVTGADGNYSFAFASGSQFTITPVKNINKLNGINASDAFRIQQHLSGNLITDPWQLIAADVSVSGTITSLDANIIQLSLLNNTQALAQFIKSWRFVPVSYALPNPPWGFPEQIDVTTGTISGAKDFYGIKVGDLAAPYANPANGGQGNPMILRVRDQVLQAGDLLPVELGVDPLSDVAAVQMALQFDPERLRFEGIEPLQALPLSADNFGLSESEAGILRMVWIAPAQGQALKHAAPLLRLRFRVLESGARLSEVLATADSVLAGRVYDSDLAESEVSLRFEQSTAVAVPDAASPLLQSHPNPFADRTLLRFALPQACEARLRLFNASGRLLWERSGAWPAGQQELWIEAPTATGLLYCELTTPHGVWLHRMIRTGR